MELTVIDRIAIKELIPERVNMLKGMLFKSIEKKVDFTPEEITKHKLLDSKTILNNIMETINVDFEEAEVTVLKERIDEMDQAGSLPFQFIELYCKIKNV